MERTSVELFDCSIRLDRLTGSSPLCRLELSFLQNFKPESFKAAAETVLVGLAQVELLLKVYNFLYELDKE
jgi:hypothetical protein